jgi:hypothetical protein
VGISSPFGTSRIGEGTIPTLWCSCSGDYENAVFWVVTQCSLKKVWCFRGTDWYHLQGQRLSQVRIWKDCFCWFLLSLLFDPKDGGNSSSEMLGFFQTRWWYIIHISVAEPTRQLLLLLVLHNYNSDVCRRADRF